MPDMSFSLVGAHVPNLLPTSVFGANIAWLRPMGRLIWATLLFAIGLAIVFKLIHTPKRSDEPTTWAAAAAGGLFTLGMMTLAYGTIPHEWLTFGNSYLGLSKASFVVRANQWGAHLPPFDIPKNVILDSIAAGIYIVMLTLNVVVFSLWQKRKVAEPVAESVDGAPTPTTAFARFRRREKGTSPYGRPVTTSE